MASSVHEALTSFEILKPEYDKLWLEAQIRPECLARVKVAVLKIEATKASYLSVEQDTNVPWYLVAALHYREANLNFHAWLHNGDPMFDHHGHPVSTVHVPRGRPTNPAVSWKAGAVDALWEFLHIPEWPIARVAWAAEKFNGFGYRKWHHILSPYLWGGMNVQEKGKYTSDGDFDPSEMDEQLGIMAIVKLILGEGTA